MNDFDDRNLYELTDAEAKRNYAGLVTALLYLVLAAVILITGAHAVMLVLSQTGAYRFGGQDSMITTILTAVRVAFPLIVEAAAVVAGIGFITSRWRGAQKTVGLAIEVVWATFAALNMITFFAVERGQDLQNWQAMWVQYGLPLSALAAGILTYALMRVDPDHKRSAERAATVERTRAVKFKFRQQALLGPALLNIERQRAYMEIIEDLRKSGYTESQIRFMISHTPELLEDGDENGTPDVLESDSQSKPKGISKTTYQPAAQAAQPAPVSANGQAPQRGQGDGRPNV